MVILIKYNNYLRMSILFHNINSTNREGRDVISKWGDSYNNKFLVEHILIIVVAEVIWMIRRVMRLKSKVTGLYVVLGFKPIVVMENK